MTSLGFVLPPHTLNEVPLFAEEVKFFPKESILAIPISKKVCHDTSFGNKLRDKSLHNCVRFRLVRAIYLDPKKFCLHSMELVLPLTL